MKSGKKLFFLLPDLYQAGGQRVVSEISLNLPENIKQTLVLFEDRVSFPYKGNLVSLGVPLSTNFLQRICAFFVRLYRFKKIVFKEKPDWVISLGNSANIINILSNKNSIIRVDMFLSKEQKGLFNFLFMILARILFNKALKIIPVSKASAADLVKNFGVKGEKITTIYNPIDVGKIQLSSKKELELEHKEIFKNPVVISAGRMVRQKGQWHLIRAFSAAKKEIKNLKLVILGDGELKPYFKELIDGYGLRRDVFLLGWQKNPFKFIAKSKLFVLPSLWEGLPMAAMEAMACGVPIISADFRSGAREILAPDTDFNFETDKIEFSQYGVLAPVCDGNFYKATQPLAREERILSEVIIKILEDEKLRSDLAGKSLRRAEYFDIKNIIKQWDFLHK